MGQLEWYRLINKILVDTTVSHRASVDSSQNGQSCETLMFSLPLAWTSCWACSWVVCNLRPLSACVMLLQWGAVASIKSVLWVSFWYNTSTFRPVQLIFKTPLLHRISQRKVRIGLSQQQSSNSADYTHLSAVQCGVRTPRGQDYVVQIDHIKDKSHRLPQKLLLTIYTNVITNKRTFDSRALKIKRYSAWFTELICYCEVLYMLNICSFSFETVNNTPFLKNDMNICIYLVKLMSLILCAWTNDIYFYFIQSQINYTKTLWHGDSFCMTGPLWGECGNRWSSSVAQTKRVYICKASNI